MNIEPVLLGAGVAGVVALLSAALQTPIGKKVGKYWPLPFWIYFFSILLAHFKILPATSDFYSFAGSILLAAAIFLMLVGTPVSSLAKMGKVAFYCLMAATGTMVISAIVTYVLFYRWLPDESWKVVGALVGTWVGGSANMIAVKEIIGLSDAGLAPLIIVDTILSYVWLAMLFVGAGWQAWFDRRGAHEEKSRPWENIPFLEEKPGTFAQKFGRTLMVLVVGYLFALGLVALGKVLSPKFGFLSASAWVLLLASAASVIMSATPLQKLETFGASRIGSFLLYMVLVTIGAKSQMGDIHSTPIFILFGAVLLILHGIMLFGMGWFFRWPLFLLSTASQASVGGPVSAPIVAAAYKAGTASIGVLMAILGALMGTYLGVLSSWICRRVVAGG